VRFFPFRELPGDPRLERPAGLGHAGFTAPFFARLLVMLAGLENLENPFSLHLLLQALEGLFKRLVLANIDF